VGKNERTRAHKNRFSARVEPFWMNPATIKGTVSIAGGLAILAFPSGTLLILRLALGIGLLVTGTGDLWFYFRRPKTSHRMRGLFEAFLPVLGGLAFLLVPRATIRVIAIVAGFYLAVRSVMALFSALRSRGHNQRGIDVTRGLLLLVFAGFLVFVPETIFSGFVVAIAAAAVVLGGVMLAYGIQHHADDDDVDIDVASMSQIVSDWMLLQDVGDARRDEIDDTLYFEPPDRMNKLVAWWVMLLLSVAIATFGIIQDSTAVVIGAMLIAPLMTPIIGTAAAAVNGWPVRITTSLAMIAAGVGASIGLAFVIGAWSPIIVPLATNSQVTSRVNPNLIDMGIALAAGAAGAFASVNRRVSASIAGVAIAVALVPPLGVVGLTLHDAMYRDSFGALLLFLTNLVSIILAAMVVFGLTGFAPVSRMKENASQIKRVATTVTLAALIIAIPLVFTVSTVLASAANQAAAKTATEAWLADSDELQLVSVTVKGEQVNVVVSGSESIPPIEDLADSLTSTIGDDVVVRVDLTPTITTKYSSDDGEQRSQLSG
jgi:uncharacterized hydrophobic protein (TIGR00271 family)